MSIEEASGKYENPQIEDVHDEPTEKVNKTEKGKLLLIAAIFIKGWNKIYFIKNSQLILQESSMEANVFKRKVSSEVKMGRKANKIKPFQTLTTMYGRWVST